mgnify:CR=1 FL=1
MISQNRFGITHWQNPSRGQLMPQEGEMCWDCQKALLIPHSFPSKKTLGLIHKGVKCPECQNSWVISQYEGKPEVKNRKYVPKPQEAQEEKTQNEDSLKKEYNQSNSSSYKVDNIKYEDKSLLFILDELRQINKRLDGMADYLAEKFSKIYKDLGSE